MFKTHEIRIGAVLRWLLGILGCAAGLSGGILVVWAIERAQSGEPVYWAAAACMLIIIASGLSLLRGAVRGRVRVRSLRNAAKQDGDRR